jgi:hypothetical protein
MHAYALASRLAQVSDHPLALNQGTLYPALVLSGDAPPEQLEMGRWYEIVDVAADLPAAAAAARALTVSVVMLTAAGIYALMSFTVVQRARRSASGPRRCWRVPATGTCSKGAAWWCCRSSPPS